MFFTDILLFILSLLYMCVGITFTLGIMIAVYRIPYHVLKWIMYYEEENNQNNHIVKKSFDYDTSQEDDSLLLSKLFKKDK